jgi:predicted O-linked N-acetylglucosamine transferase (SPINDLY family)
MVQHLFDRAVGFFQQGRLAEAERDCLQLLDAAPANAQAALLLGAIRAAQDRNAEALALIGGVLEKNPRATAALLNYGNVLKAMGRDEEALEYCDRVLGLEPGHAGALYNRASLLLRLKRFEDALAGFGSVLAIKPDHAEALNHRGTALYYLGRGEEALASYEKALAIRPDFADAWNNRGIALRDRNRLDEALASFDKALEARPDHAEAWRNRGDALRDLKRFAEAVAGYDRALRLKPDDVAALHNRGTCLYFLKRVDEALASYDAALSIRPDYADALHSRGMVRWREGQQYEAAVRDLEALVRMCPDHDYARGDLLHLKMHGNDWSGFEEQVSLIDAGVRAGWRVVDPFMYLAISDSPSDLQACAAIFTAHFHPPAPMPPQRSARGGGKIRLGYVSGEFRAQATAYLTAGLYECHDKSRFEIVAFDNGERADSPMRRRLEAAFDRFVPIAQLSDRAAAQAIAAEGIDILVDLNGYFGNHRMGVFAHRPAPIQVNCLGFPGTLGADYIDYIIADRFVIPPGGERHYTEKVVRLPDSYQVNDSRRHLPQGAPRRCDHGLPETGFVFCDFNMSYKLTPAMFAAWMRILKQVEGSVLWLLQANAVSPGNLRRAAERHGVAADRLVFAPFVAMEKQLDRLQLAGLFLDTLPCNAHTTASDALWAGVPLLTCRGNSFSGRVAASLLDAAGLPELVTESLEAYERLAVALARDPAALQAIRRKLALRRHTAPLFDTARYCRHLEAAYGRMWDIFQRGGAPQGFAVAP